MKPTALPAVKAAVLATLQGAAEIGSGTGLDGITVAKGTEPSKKEYVWIWKGSSKREFKTLTGPAVPAPLEEIVKVAIRVVAIGGEDPEARVYELQRAAEEALRNDKTLGDAVMWHRLEELDEEPLMFDQKLGCAVVMTLTAQARI